MKTNLVHQDPQTEAIKTPPDSSGGVFFYEVMLHLSCEPFNSEMIGTEEHWSNL